MKRFFFPLVAAMALSVGGAMAADEIVFVDVQELFKNFYKTKMAKDQLRQQTADVKLEHDQMQEEVTALKEAVEVLRKDSRDETLSVEVRQSKRDQLEEKLVDLQKKEKEATEFKKLRQQQMEQQNTRMTKKLYDEIHSAISNYGKAKNAAAIIDRSSQSRIGTDNILYVSGQADVTGELLLILNEGREELLKGAGEGL